MVAAVVNPERLIFVDECVLGIPPLDRSTATRPEASACICRYLEKPGQEHDAAAFEHELRGDRPFAYRGRSDHIPGI
jgi:hypothetical protein